MCARQSGHAGRIHRAVALALALLAGVTSSARAQDFQIVRQFGNYGAIAPRHLMQATDGHLYFSVEHKSALPDAPRTTSIYKMTPQGQVVGGWEVAIYQPILETRSGDLYGVGRVPSVGPALFKLLPGGVEVIHRFDGTAGYPRGGLIEGTDGRLYGTTQNGGDARLGAIFAVVPDASSFTTLHSFRGPDDGASPEQALLVAPDGTLYGTTAQGGSSGLGTLFSVTPGGVLTVKHHFSGGTRAAPTTPLVFGLDGNIYGATAEGGAYGFGDIYRLSSTGPVSTFYSFTGGSDQGHPQSLIATSDGRLCAATLNRFICVTSSGVPVVVHAGVNGELASSPLIHGLDGFFYGTFATIFDRGGTVVRVRNRSACDASLALTYRDGTLRVLATVRAETTAWYGAWMVIDSVAYPFWGDSIPRISPGQFFDVTMPGFPPVGNVSMLTWLQTTAGDVCADWETVDTGGGDPGVS
jgi:uncharacterized repeat protein (TIGR03803 family)